MTRTKIVRPHNLVTIGHVGFDTAHTPKGRKRFSGGAAYFTTKGASLFSRRVGVVTRIGRDFNIGLLKKLGIDVSGVKVIRSGRSFNWKAKYDKDFNRISAMGQLNVGARLRPQDIPNNFINAKQIHISTMLPVLQQKIIQYLRIRGCRAKISIDTVEQFIKEKPEQIKAVVQQADIIFLNDREYQLVKRLVNMRTKMVIRKLGENGAEVHWQGKVFHANAPKIKTVIDTTGAGDMLAGAFLALLANGKKPQEALKKAVIIASESVTRFGVEHV